MVWKVVFYLKVSCPNRVFSQKFSKRFIVESNGKNSSFEDRAFKINKHSKILISQFTQKFCSEHFVHLNGFSRDKKKTIIARPGIRAKAQPTKAIRPFQTQHQPSSLGIQLGQPRTQVGFFLSNTKEIHIQAQLCTGPNLALPAQMHGTPFCYSLHQKNKKILKKNLKTMAFCICLYIR